MYNNVNKVSKIICMAAVMSFILTGCGVFEKYFLSDKREYSAKDTYDMPVAGEAVIITGSRGEGDPVRGTIQVAVVGTIEAEILQEAGRMLALKGYELKIDMYEDYRMPNEKIQSGQADCNFYQHGAFLERYNLEHNTDLTAYTAVYYQPMAIYGGKINSLSQLKEGAVVAVPEDITGYARALFLLQQEGLLTLASDTDLRATKEDILENKYNLEFMTLPEEEMMEKREEADLVICRTGFTLAAGRQPQAEALAYEKEDSYPVSLLSKILVVKSGAQKKAAPLAEVLTSEEMKKYILEQYNGSLIPLGKVFQEEETK